MLTKVKIKIIFELREPKTKASQIRLVIYYGAYKVINEKRRYIPFRKTLPWKVPCDLWDKQKLRIKKSSSFKHSEAINAVLSKLTTYLEEYSVKSDLNSERIHSSGLTEIVDSVIMPRSAEIKTEYFADIIAEVISKSISGERLMKDGNKVSEATIKKYKNALWHLENYEAIHGDVFLKDLNLELGEKLHAYFNDIELAHNTKASLFTQYISFYNYAIKKELIEKTDFQKIKLRDISSDTIALTREEINTIFAMKLRAEEQLELVRDVFIIGVWTLMRFSDYSQMKSYNIKDDHIKMNTEKTQTQVYLPIHWQLEEVLDRYNGKLPEAPSLTMFNRLLKEIARKAGIDKMEEIRVHKGGTIRKKIVPRYELVSTHTARRTGASLLYLDGIPKKQIMLLTGHKTEEMFDRYVKIGAYANARMLSQRDIFKKEENLSFNIGSYPNGFYWILNHSEVIIAELDKGILYFGRNGSVVKLENFLNSGGRILAKVERPF